MTELRSLISRNCRLFYKDKGTFFTSLITPVILLVLYMTFLAKVYQDTFTQALTGMVSADDPIIKSLVNASLFSSLLAVSSVTVAFCSNMIMVQDKASGVINDLRITPVKRSVLSLGYYVSTTVSTLTICLITGIIYCIYMAISGWYLTAGELLLILLDIFLLVMMGTALSSIINVFISTQGQMSAVGTIVSSGYGFICGAYMPLSQFGAGLRTVLSFLPGTYGTAILKNLSFVGIFRELSNKGVPNEAIDELKGAFDCVVSFFDTTVELGAMFAVLSVAVVILVLIYVLLNVRASKAKR